MYWCEFLVEGTKLLRPRRKKLTSLAYLIIINVAFNFAHILKFQPIILTKPKQHHKLITNLETYKLSTKIILMCLKFYGVKKQKKYGGPSTPWIKLCRRPCTMDRVIAALLLLHSQPLYPARRLVGSRPSDHYFRSVCMFVCPSVCLFVQSFSQPSSIRFGSN